jgi:MoaA/NifB/PqqE/SkfB family radical SAM enzyme
LQGRLGSIMFCTRPFEWMEVLFNNDVYMCCPTKLPKVIGNVKNNNIADIWNGEEAKEIRLSIIDQSFKYCKECPYLLNKNGPVSEKPPDPYMLNILENKLLTLEKGPKWLNLSNDKSCNLACPSCRLNFIQVTDEVQLERLTNETNEIINQVKKDLEWLYICGSGDPFGSKLYRNLLYSMKKEDYPNLKIYLHTNAILFDENTWNKLIKIRECIDWVHVSIDGSTKKTYEENRVGGKWERLVKNLEFISSLRNKNEISMFEISFVVQQNNWNEMKQFVEFGRRLNVDKVTFSPIDNWDRGCIYSEKAVHLQSHPEHNEFVKFISSRFFKSKDIDLGLLTKLREISML